MADRKTGLSTTAATILDLIAEGRSYDQILRQHPELTHHDIFAAAREAIDQLRATHGAQNSGEPEDAPEEAAAPKKNDYVARARQKYPRAYERWTDDEDERLTQLFTAGKTVTEIRQDLQRGRGSINSRLLKLGLITESDGHASEQDAARRSGADGPARAAQLRESVASAAEGWRTFRDRLRDHLDAPGPRPSDQ